MPGEGPPPPVPVTVIENPSPTAPPASGDRITQPISATPNLDQSQPVPKGEATPPATAEHIPQATYETAHTQVMGWVGEVNPDKDPMVIIEQANIILTRNKQPPLQPTPEIIGQIVLAQHHERTNRVNAAKAKLETATNIPQPEEPPEETRAQIKDHIDDAWEKGMELLVQESITNVWNENAPDISSEDKLIRVTARRFKSHITAVKEYTKQMLDEENKTRLNSKPPKPVLTGAEAAEFRNKINHDLRANPAQLETKHYMYDATKGKYICKGTDGKTVTDEFAPYELVAPMLSGLKDLSGRKGTDDQPTSQATDAQNSLQVLEKYRKGDGIVARTESELQAEMAHREIFDTAYQTIAHYLGKDITDALVAGTTDKYDLKQVLERIKKTPNMALADLATTIYIYHHGGAKDNATMQGNIDASLYYQLQGLTDGLNAEKPELAAKIKNLSTQHDGLMKKRLENARIRIQDFLIKEKLYVDDKNILRVLIMSTFFEGQTELTQAHGLQLTGDAHQIVLGLRQKGLLSVDDGLAITHLAHEKAGSGLFNALYGVDIKSLMSVKTVGDMSTFVIGELIKQNNLEFKLTEAQRAIADQILKTHMTETGLKRLNQMKLPAGMSMIMMFAILLLPLFQQTADDDGVGKGGGRGGES